MIPRLRCSQSLWKFLNLYVQFSEAFSSWSEILISSSSQIIDNLVSTRCVVRRIKIALISACNSSSTLIKKKQRWNDDGKTTTRNGKLRGNLIKLIHYECNFLELPICNYVIIVLEIEIYFLITKRGRKWKKVFSPLKTLWESLFA